MLFVVTLTFINSQIIIIFFLFMVFLSLLFIFLLWNSILIITKYTVKCKYSKSCSIQHWMIWKGLLT